jgi:hypothetical protein
MLEAAMHAVTPEANQEALNEAQRYVVENA